MTTADKLREFYDTDQLRHAVPVPGCLDALNRLQEMGYGLTIVTARTLLREVESTVIWIDNHFNGKAP
jgi:phosphoglycolate phosphatase-like HAD superfamily hydrolase